MTDGRKKDTDRQAEARRILERVASDSWTIGGSTLARTTTRLTDHFLARDNAEDDAIEVLGKRIGRALGLIAFVGLAVYLFVAYVVAR